MNPSPPIPPALHTLTQRLARTIALRPPEAVAAAAAHGLYAGFETQTNPATYRWDGRKRNRHAGASAVVFQYTLAGQGAYHDASGTHLLPPTNAFLAVLPSDHTYYLPDGQTWTFIWNILYHPYIVERLTRAVGGTGRTLTLAPTSPVLLAAIALVEGTCASGFPDAYERDSALFRFMLELERCIAERSTSPSDRDQLLASVRSQVLENLSHRIQISELADRHGMSRSHFAHHFKSLTHTPPARYITHLRLAEAARLLTTTNHSLKQLAARCGFADANHLCKAFRRHYHITPATYRARS